MESQRSGWPPIHIDREAHEPKEKQKKKREVPNQGTGPHVHRASLEALLLVLRHSLLGDGKVEFAGMLFRIVKTCSCTILYTADRDTNWMSSDATGDW